MTPFLLHCCCAPCGIVAIDELRQQYDLSVLFYNPNIYPEEEYLRRKREVVRLCTEWGVSIVDCDYMPAEWTAGTAGLEREPEGGLRCQSCIALRLMRTAREAATRGIGLFGTTLTMGRRKKAAMITPLGMAAAARYGVTYMVEDWKKRGREETARRMVAERGIYRQNYCGCRYSLEHNFDLD